MSSEPTWIKFGLFLDLDQCRNALPRPKLMALDRCSGHHPGHAGALLRQPSARPGHGQARRVLRRDRPDQHPRRTTAPTPAPTAPRPSAKAGRRSRPGSRMSTWRLASSSMGKVAFGRWRRRIGHPRRGRLLGSAPCLVVRPRRPRAHPQTRHHLRAVRQGVGEELPSLSPTPRPCTRSKTLLQEVTARR